MPAFRAFSATLAALTAMLTLGLFAFVVSPSLAAESGPQWTVSAVSRPTNFIPGDQSGEDSYKVLVTNTGGAEADGETSPITITDELPQGLTLDSMGASGENLFYNVELGKTGGNASAHFSCVFSSCTYTAGVVPDQGLLVTIPVEVAASAPASVTNVVRVSGGGAPAASMHTPTTISSEPAKFGISPGGATTALSSNQAGAHPDITTSIAFNTVNQVGSLAGDPKNTVDRLPPGFASDFLETPTCSPSQLAEEACPIPTQIGITTLIVDQGSTHSQTYVEPVYNLTPSAGEVAKLGFYVAGNFFIQGDITLRPGDYGADVTFRNIPELLTELDDVSLTVWGVPAASAHDALRWDGFNPANEHAGFGESSTALRLPFFTNPTSCGTEPLDAEFSVTSWENPNESESPAATKMGFGPLVGCDSLGMQPSVTAEATTSSASSASGLDLNMTIPQTYENPEGLATSTLEQAVVTLPEGMTVNPSAGAGLGACTQAQYEAEPVQYVAGQGCPNESRLGTVEIETPLLAEKVKGSVFLAQPYANPFKSAEQPGGSLLALYVVARIPNRGVLIKVAGEVQANVATGQLVTTFDDLPPLPFTRFVFGFRQGATSPLVTPPACGSYTVQAALTPYASPAEAPLTPSIPSFPITSGVGGGACPSGGLPPFSPQVSAGTENNSAGSYSPLDIHIARNDGEQEITGFGAQLPPGLTANLSGVPFCSEAAIAAARTERGAEEEASPSCPAASEIGHTIAEAGVGSVLAQAPGKIYMAGPFEGAPFSVVSITAAKVGPFDLGTVVVHLPLDINPETAAVSIPAGAADQIPHIIKGIVIHVRDIRVYIERQDFTLNPTSCAQESIAATVIGGGANPTDPAGYDSVTVGDPFQAADCSSLKFAPKFSASTAGRTSRVDGASLHVDLAYPAGALGNDANIKQVKVELPKQLPSRLPTLQKACTAAQFAASPAGCPAASVIGHAKALTPILPVPLEGPAYFVSHGGEAFPSLEIVLQGYGVTIVLTGDTSISKTGITSSTFKAVPDQPITSFELTLPEGQFSALAATTNLCKSKLTMPTEFMAQNGDTIHQSTPIAVTGCAKVKTLTRAQKLAKALRTCKQDKSKGRRVKCEKTARKKYDPIVKQKGKKRK